MADSLARTATSSASTLTPIRPVVDRAGSYNGESVPVLLDSDSSQGIGTVRLPCRI